MRKIKKNGNAQIIASKDKGKGSKVLYVDAAKNRVIVKGYNMMQKHQRSSSQNQNDGIMSKGGFIHVSNAALLTDGEHTKVGLELRDDEKVRIAKKNGEVIS